MASIPDEVMFHILSFLPEKSLARFRCLSRLLYTLFLDHKFRYLFLKRSRFHDEEDLMLLESCPPLRITEYFFPITESSDDLQLLESCVSPRRYRIECPYISHSIDFPGPQNPSVCYAIEFVPSRRAYMLVSAYEADNQGWGLGYEVLRIGIDDHITPTTTSFCWRPLQVPYLNNTNIICGRKRKRLTNLKSMGLCCMQQHNYFNISAVREGLVLFFRKGVAYCIWSYGDDKIYDHPFAVQVDVLDVANECYIGHTTLPRTSFPEQTGNIQLLDWNGQLSLAQLVSDELHVFVLDNYINLNWTKRIIKLSFFSKHANACIELINLVDDSTLFFLLLGNCENNVLCSIDIDTGNVTTTVYHDCDHRNMPDMARYHCILSRGGAQ